MTNPVAERAIGFAFLGCGSATRTHGRILASLRAPVRRYYASRDAERARTLAAKTRASGAFGSYEEALTSEAVDAVVVALPPAHHLEWTLRALAAGKHVIVEKPAFPGVADFDAAKAAAEGAGRRLLVAENYHYKPLARRLRKLLGSGSLGDVLFLHVNALKEQNASGWRTEPSLSVRGALLEGGIHWVSLMANLGLAVRSVHGLFPGRPGARLERSALLTFEYEEGAVGVLAYSWEVSSPWRGLRISRIYGRRGSAAFESNGLFLAVWGRHPRLILLPGVRDIAGYRSMWRDFLRALATGSEPEMSLERARRDLELVERAYGESPESGAGDEVEG